MHCMPVCVCARVCVLLWTCKVLCGRFYVPHTHFCSFIHSIIINSVSQNTEGSQLTSQSTSHSISRSHESVSYNQLLNHLNQTCHSGANRALRQNPGMLQAFVRPILSRNQSGISKTVSQSATVNCSIISINHTIWGKHRPQNLKVSLINLLFSQNQHTRELIGARWPSHKHNNRDRSHLR